MLEISRSHYLVDNIWAKHDVERAAKPVDVYRFAMFVAKQHSGQHRRDGSIYYLHCCKVARLAKEIAQDYDNGLFKNCLITQSVCEAAGYGHDLLEDTKTDYEDIQELVGDEVASIISWVSDDKRLPVRFRYAFYLNRLSATPLNAQIVKLADLYDNTDDSFDLFKARPVNINFIKRWHKHALDCLHTLTKVDKSKYYIQVQEMLDRLKYRIDTFVPGTACDCSGDPGSQGPHGIP